MGLDFPFKRGIWDATYLPAPKHATREQWLIAARDWLAPHFTKRHASLGRVRLALGFPASRQALGECWADSVSRDATREIFISPCYDDVPTLLFTVVHELCHAVFPASEGHGRKWAKLADSFGLQHGPGGSWAGVGGPRFLEFIAPLISELGPLPHAAMTLGPIGGMFGFGGIGGTCGGSRVRPKAKQSTRMRLWECDCAPKPVKVRVASNEFKAHCDLCGGGFHPRDDSV